MMSDGERRGLVVRGEGRRRKRENPRSAPTREPVGSCAARGLRSTAVTLPVVSRDTLEASKLADGDDDDASSSLLWSQGTTNISSE